MAVLPIRSVPDSVLKQKAKKVPAIDGSIKKLIRDMLETMHAEPGRVGLAAPQVGVPLRIIVIGMPEEEDLVLINPQIVRRRGERIIDEGCLSVPGYFGQIKRAESITVKGRDRDGKEARLKAEGLLAQALEHEIDHLNGTLYIDHPEVRETLRKIQPEEIGL
ncbi:MAG: peptide deformylase [Dehalococcoidia bacterium]|nr:MAG: peptide deformylase [Dehalococcoidia bacterium]